MRRSPDEGITARTETNSRYFSPTKLQEVEALHRKAMECAERALIARINGESVSVQSHFEEAYKFESQAADMIAYYDLEPTRSVVHRSAATLALDCGRYKDAVVLARRGLHGLPPNEIEQELQDVLAKIPEAILLSVPESPASVAAEQTVHGFPWVTVIQVDWDPKTGGLTVTPSKVRPGTVVRFENPKGNKVRIVFLSPDGKETDSVTDSQTYTLATDGTFNFECFFTPPGSTKVMKALRGAIVVTPHVP